MYLPGNGKHTYQVLLENELYTMVIDSSPSGDTSVASCAGHISRGGGEIPCSPTCMQTHVLCLVWSWASLCGAPT